MNMGATVRDRQVITLKFFWLGVAARSEMFAEILDGCALPKPQIPPAQHDKSLGLLFIQNILLLKAESASVPKVNWNFGIICLSCNCMSFLCCVAHGVDFGLLEGDWGRRELPWNETFARGRTGDIRNRDIPKGWLLDNSFD
jgi:hypothetical protein